MGPEDPEALAVAGGGPDGVAGRAVGVALGARGDLGEGVFDVGVADSGERLARRASGGDRGEAQLHVPAVLLEVAYHEGLDGRAVVGIEVAATGEVVGQGAGLVQGPGLEGGHELDLVDQAVLQGEQAEEQVAIGGEGGHGAGLRAGRRWRRAFGLRRREPAAGLRRMSFDYPITGRNRQPHRDRSAHRSAREWVSLLRQKAHAPTSGQNPSAVARARCQGYGSLPTDDRRPAHSSSCPSVKDGLHRTVRLDRCRRRGFIISNRLSRCALRSDDTEADWAELASVDHTEAQRDRQTLRSITPKRANLSGIRTSCPVPPVG